jgi:hypothetical protein
VARNVRREAAGALISAPKSQVETSAAAEVAEEDRLDLEHLERDLLRRRWRSIMRRSPPRDLSRALMIRVLMWREQIAEVGDLDARTRGILAAALKGQEHTRTGEKHRATGSGFRPSPSEFRGNLRPGTVLLREHDGTLHRVTVLAEGFDWKGETFRSLSAVARAITGTSWNGHRFFGLAKGRSGSSPSVTAARAPSDRSQTSRTLLKKISTDLPFTEQLPGNESGTHPNRIDFAQLEAARVDPVPADTAGTASSTRYNRPLLRHRGPLESPP